LPTPTRAISRKPGPMPAQEATTSLSRCFI
jgi:hypothetical protein